MFIDIKDGIIQFKYEFGQNQELIENCRPNIGLGQWDHYQIGRSVAVQWYFGYPLDWWGSFIIQILIVKALNDAHNTKN